MEEATWEPQSNLDHCTEAIEEYFQDYPGNPGGPDSFNRRPSLKEPEKAI